LVPSANPPPLPAIADSGQRRFICRGCYFIYEEPAGLAQAGIEPGTSFAALPAEWRCPD
jgi:GntR family transcriptional regulator/MocR family aminotransferase